MVTKSSPVTSMHILMRRSWSLSTSQAEAWHTTSRSFGFVKSERSQNVWGRGSNPSEVKKRSPDADHLPLVDLLGLQQRREIERGRGLRRSHERVHVLPALRPHVAEEVGGDRPRGGHDLRARTSPRGGRARRREATCRADSPAARCRSTSAEKARRAACRSSSARGRPCRQSRGCARPGSRAPRSARTSASSAARWSATRARRRAARRGCGSRPSPSRARRCPGSPFRAGSTCPCRSRLRGTPRARSARSAASRRGARAGTSDSFRSFSLRATSSGRVRPSKRVASTA